MRNMQGIFKNNQKIIIFMINTYLKIVCLTLAKITACMK